MSESRIVTEGTASHALLHQVIGLDELVEALRELTAELRAQRQRDGNGDGELAGMIATPELAQRVADAAATWSEPTRLDLNDPSTWPPMSTSVLMRACFRSDGWREAELMRLPGQVRWKYYGDNPNGNRWGDNGDLWLPLPPAATTSEA